MSAQDVILGSRVAHVRELQAEIAALRARNTALQNENAAFKAHFDLALLAAEDVRTLPPGGRMAIVDGWNLVLGAGREVGSRRELIDSWRGRIGPYDAATGFYDRVWIVFDGADEHVLNEPCGLRVSYTGGTGEHRADRFICAYLRMAAYLGFADRIVVVTRDKDFARTAAHLTENLPAARGTGGK